jgi:hypothetical protein
MSRLQLSEPFWRRASPENELVAFAANYPVFVYMRGTEEEATFWSAEEGGSEVGQPLRTDDNGQAVDGDGNLVWLDYDEYDVVVNGERIPWPPFTVTGGEGGAVSSVNGKTGVVTGLEETSNKDTSGSLGTSDAKYPSQKAVKTYVDAEKTAREADVDAEQSAREAADAAAKALFPIFAVKDSAYGAKGDGATDDATAINAAITAAAAAGGVVYFAPGTYIVGSTLTLKSKVRLEGAGIGVSVLKLKNAANTDVVKTSAYGGAGTREFSVRALTIDGNKANNSSGSGLLLDGQHFAIEHVDIHHCATDNLNAQMTTETVLDTEGGDEAFVRGVRSWLAGGRNIRWAIRDGHLSDVIAIQKDEGSTLTNILIDTAGSATKCVNCHAWGQSKYAWQVKANVEAINCSAEGAVTSNVIWEADNSQWIGGKVFKDGSEHGLVGFTWASTKGNNTVVQGVQIEGCNEPFKFTGEGGGSRIAAKITGLASGKKAVNGTPAESVVFDLDEPQGGGTVGSAQKRRRSTSNATDVLFASRADGDTNDRFEQRADGLLLWGPGSAGTDVWLQRLEKEALKVAGRLVIEKRSEEVASANTMTVKDGIVTTVLVTGTTEIKKVNATSAGHLIVLKFAGSLTVKNGENLKLGADFATEANATLCLVCDGTNWYPVPGPNIQTKLKGLNVEEHSFSLPGALAVKTYRLMYSGLASGETKKLIGMYFSTGSGTAKFSLKQNGSAVTNFKEKEAKAELVEVTGQSVAVAAKDLWTLTVESVSSAEDAVITLLFENSR